MTNNTLTNLPSNSHYKSLSFYPIQISILVPIQISVLIPIQISAHIRNFAVS